VPIFAENASIACSDPGLRLRPAVDTDGPFLRHLFKASRAEGFAAAQLPAAALDALLDQQFRVQTASYALQFPGSSSFLIEWRQRAIGRLMLFCGCECWHVIDLMLLDADRGQGIGTDVMQSVAVEAGSKGVGLLTLVVLEANQRARRFYTGLGFAGMGGPTESGHLVMIKQLGPH
jgi:GNAT superfamily N-acetyltransferase